MVPSACLRAWRPWQAKQRTEQETTTVSTTGASSALEWADGNFATYTEKASGLTRSLALASIATVWLFAGGLSVAEEATPQQVLQQTQASNALLLALVAAVLALGLDLLHYLYGALAWGIYKKVLEGREAPHSAGGSSRQGVDTRESDDQQAPRVIRMGIDGLFWLKNVALVVSYGALPVYLF